MANINEKNLDTGKEKKSMIGFNCEYIHKDPNKLLACLLWHQMQKIFNAPFCLTVNISNN